MVDARLNERCVKRCGVAQAAAVAVGAAAIRFTGPLQIRRIRDTIVLRVLAGRRGM